jgi:anthranilate synthase component 1
MFESAISSDEGNFSFIFIGAQERVWHQDGQNFYESQDGKTERIDEDPFQFLKAYYRSVDHEEYKKINLELGVGFSDGFVGYTGYESMKFFEPSLKENMEALTDEIGMPDVEFIRPKITLAFSHKNNILTLIARDESEFDTIEQALRSDVRDIPMKRATFRDEGTFAFSKERFFDMVDRCKEHIKSGDVFQILMANRYTRYGDVDKLSFYRRLRSKNPSPYLYLLDFNTFAIEGSSPEVMVALNDGRILLRPIAGTRKRGQTALKDKEMEDELVADVKERAEHLMLVDLGRNDVGRVAKPGTVKVTELMRVERYSHVMHLVSDVYADIDEAYDMFDLLAATFTAGTMTGAPKIKAMELIAKYEGIKRNFYSGCVGYFGFDGNMDSAITIRTALLSDDRIVLQAGAGVVADSKPELEYLEVNNKLGALVATLDEMSKS